MSDNQTVLEPFSYTLPQRPIEDYFPFNEVRPAQKRAFEAVVRAISKGYRNIILELPTGTGKSGIGFALGAWLGENRITPEGSGYETGAYILSTQLSLTEQYMKDFAHLGLVELRGSNNYSCECFGTDCSMGGKLRAAAKKNAEKNPDGGDSDVPQCGGCPYRAAKNAFKSSPVGISNFAYFLNETHYAKELKPREALIVDEAHNIEAQIVGHADIEVTNYRCRRFGLELPTTNELDRTNAKSVHWWLYNVFVPIGERIEMGLKIEMGDAVDNGDMVLARKLAKDHDSIDKFLCKVRRFTATDNIDAWLTYTGDNDSIRIKPLYATLYSEELLLKQGALRIFMSATILNQKAYERNLGLNPEETGMLRLPSDFPEENRPVFFRALGSMSSSSINTSKPNMFRAVDFLLDKHKNEKGIIHTNSYKLQNELVEYLHASPHIGRILAHSNEPGDRIAKLDTHLSSPDPTVLISPSMTEGCDLKGDLARWQCILKCPYPNLGDAWVRRRMNEDSGWYTWLTVITLLQASGRVVRSDTDWAKTYIFDSDFGRVYSNSRHLFPQWWQDGLHIR